MNPKDLVVSETTSSQDDSQPSKKGQSKPRRRRFSRKWPYQRARIRRAKLLAQDGNEPHPPMADQPASQNEPSLQMVNQPASQNEPSLQMVNQDITDWETPLCERCLAQWYDQWDTFVDAPQRPDNQGPPVLRVEFPYFQSFWPAV